MGLSACVNRKTLNLALLPKIRRYGKLTPTKSFCILERFDSQPANKPA